MAILGRDALEARQIETKEVEVPAWGGSILIRKLTAAEATKYMSMAGTAFDTTSSKITDPEHLVRFMAQGVIWSWVDEVGAQIAGPDDMTRLCSVPYEVLDAINDAIREYNGFGAGAGEALTAAKKNSQTTANGDSGTS